MNTEDRLKNLLKIEPKPIEPAEELHRIRLQIMALHEVALNAAEREQPGFCDRLNNLLDREKTLSEKEV